jgi:hypothetical protein
MLYHTFSAPLWAKYMGKLMNPPTSGELMASMRIPLRRASMVEAVPFVVA